MYLWVLYKEFQNLAYEAHLGSWDPISKVMREARYPFLTAVTLRWSYFASFLSLAPSNTVSKGIVSSTITITFFKSSHHTISGLTSVGTTWVGKE